MIPLGLVLNELLTNTFKQTFPNNEKGEIKIKLKLEDENMINIVIPDNGGRLPENMDFRSCNSIGLQTMFSLIEHQLLGSVEYEVNNGLT